MEEQKGDAVEVPESKAQEAEELQKQVEARQQQSEKALTDYKNLQATHQKAIEEGRITQGLATQLERMETRFEDLEMNQAILLDKIATTNSFEEPQQAVQSAQATLIEERAKRQKEADEQKQFNQALELFNETAKANGIDVKDPDFIAAVVKTSTGPAEALSKIVPYAEKQKADKQAEAERKAKEEEEAVKQEEEIKAAETSGELDQLGVGAPAGTGGGIPTTEKEFNEWLEGLSDEEFREKRSEILAMQYGGKIK